MDNLLFKLIHGFAGRWEGVDGVALFLSDYAGYILFCVFALIVWKEKKTMLITQGLLAILISRGVITEGIRFLWERPRPFVELGFAPLLEHSASPSFPSGHASFYFALSAVMFAYSKKLGILFFAVSFLMGLARVFVGVHWPSDILGGALIGIVLGFIVVELQRRRNKKSGSAT